MLQGCVRLSVVCDVCIVAKRCVLEQKLYWQPIESRMWGIDCYQNEWPWPLFNGRLRSCQPSRHIRRSKGPLIGLRYGQSVVTVGSRRCGLSKWLLGPTSCASYGGLSGHCLKMRVKHWSRRSSPVAWTTATLCSSATRKDWWIGCMQSVQNAAARLVTGTRCSDHISDITPVLSQLHWLPVRQRVDFKVHATLVHRSLSGISPSYLANDRRLFADVRERTTRSTTCWTCIVSCDVDTFESTIEDLQLLDLDYGSVCHRMRKRQLHLSYNWFRRSRRHFCLDSAATAQCELF